MAGAQCCGDNGQDAGVHRYAVTVSTEDQAYGGVASKVPMHMRVLGKMSAHRWPCCIHRWRDRLFIASVSVSNLFVNDNGLASVAAGNGWLRLCGQGGPRPQSSEGRQEAEEARADARGYRGRQHYREDLLRRVAG